jgi:hypothetical protein
LIFIFTGGTIVGISLVLRRAAHRIVIGRPEVASAAPAAENVVPRIAEG